LAAIAERSRLPVILYNIPKFTSPISPAAFGKLLEIENVTAMKDSSGSVTELLAFLEIAEKKKGFNILVGWEEMLVSAAAVGAKGCMTASGGIFPEIMSAIMGAVQNGEWEKAARLQKIIAKATLEMKKVFFPYGYKLAMEARGFEMGGCRVKTGGGYTDEKKLIANAVNDAVNMSLEYNIRINGAS
jgi:dihydrodipicolinate synthase/N-acetylneuraminate lyase